MSFLLEPDNILIVALILFLVVEGDTDQMLIISLGLLLFS